MHFSSAHKTPSATAAQDPDGPGWRNAVAFVIICLAIALLPIMSHAGGLGIAAITTLAGWGGYALTRPSAVRFIPAWFWGLAVFLAWVMVSSLWSPYQDPHTLPNPVKLGVGVVFYLGIILAFRLASQPDRNILRHLMIAVTVLSVGLIVIDIMTGYALTFFVDPLQPGENIIRKGGDAEMNIGHALTVLALLLAPIMAMMERQFKMGGFFAIIFACFVAFAAIIGQLAVGIVAVIAVLMAVLCARFQPIKTIHALIWVATISILSAPFVGYLMEFASPEFKASIPFSWEHRLEMWGYTAGRILESPLWGHGFDAVRTFDATFSSRGIENWAVVSLHPHNAGLHIWVETGLIGAALACVALMMIGVAAENFVGTSRLRGIAVAGFLAAAIVISNITYGVWQDWWWATLIFISGSLYLLPKEHSAR